MATLFPERTDPDGLTFRPLSSQGDFDACVELQRATWGRDFSEAVPPSILKIVQQVGGISAGAFDAGGRILGFVFGVTGLHGGRPVHWSHMLGVAPAGRDLGLGTRLKLYQRECLLPLGVEEIRWTYDPLEARNAHLNFNHLGVEVAEYVEDMYENEMGSELAQGIGTDRFIVSWRLAGERAARALRDRRAGSADPFREAPVANPHGEERELPEASRVRVEVPENVQALKVEQPETALAYRQSTRRVFETCLARGYRIETFYRDPAAGRCFYGVEKD